MLIFYFIFLFSENDMLRKEVTQLRRRSRQQEHVLNKVLDILKNNAYSNCYLSSGDTFHSSHDIPG